MSTELVAYCALSLVSGLGSILWFFFKRLNTKMDRACESLGAIQQTIIKLQDEQAAYRDEVFRLERRLAALEYGMQKPEVQ